jgi:hypothetical protein
VSQPSSNVPGAVEVPAQKQRADVYTVMLIIAFICIVTATILMYAELKRWGGSPPWNTSDAKASADWHELQLGHPLASNQFVA